MICRLALLLALALIPGQTRADDPRLRPGERVFSDDELAQLAQGNTLTFFDDGQSRFSAGGAYSYTYPDSGGTAFGVFKIHEGGQICIVFRNGFDRCDFYVRKGNLHYLITETGDRFPFRIELTLKP